MSGDGNCGQSSCVCDEILLPGTWQFGVKNMTAYLRTVAGKGQKSPLSRSVCGSCFFLQPVSADIPACVTSFTSSQSKAHAHNIVLLALPWGCVCLCSPADGGR